MPNNVMYDACIRFFVNPPVNDKDSIYTEAVNRAYGDMSRHTLHYTNSNYIGDSSSANKARNSIKDTIKNYLMEIETQVFAVKNQKEYDDLHYEMCKRVARAFTSAKSEENKPIELTSIRAYHNPTERKDTFSMGQAQKMVNMAWKYVYLFYQYFNAQTKDYKTEIKSFNKVIKYLHAPVDGYVIEASKSRKHKLKCVPPKYAWSQLFYFEYRSFQKSLRAKLEERNQYPFIWELKNYPFK